MTHNVEKYCSSFYFIDILHENEWYPLIVIWFTRERYLTCLSTVFPQYNHPPPAFFFFFSNNGHLFKACPCRSDMTVVSRTGELESVNLLLAPVLGCDWGEARRARSLEASQCGDRRLVHTSDSSAKSLFNNNTPNLKVERNVCEEIPHVQAARLLCLTESLLGLF